MAKFINNLSANQSAIDFTDQINSLNLRSDSINVSIEDLRIQIARSSLRSRAGIGNTSREVFEIIDGARYDFLASDLVDSPEKLQTLPSDKNPDYKDFWILERGGVYTWSYLVAHRYQPHLDIILSDGSRYVTLNATVADYEENPSNGGLGYVRLSSVS